jgi:hypothetical protein
VSDVHCPATLLLTDPDEQSSGLAGVLRGARVAAVYASGAAADRAEIVAAGLGVRSSVVAGLEAAGERFAEALQGIADEHRGETVLVCTDAGVVSREVPRLAFNVPADFAAGRSATGALVEVDCDADGWVLRSWGDQRLDQRTP